MRAARGSPATNSLRLTCIESSTLPIGHLAAELLGVSQRLGHAVAGELTAGQLRGVLGAARRRRARGRGSR